jgi:hypothetical protein
MTLLLIYIAIFAPYKIAFFDTTQLSVEILEYTVDCLFFTDICINFFSSYYDDDDRLVSDRKLIAISYIKSWFFFDLLVW